ncbi:LLM class F420-dependent oxidoreductase [Flindersiella endophytica]
MTALRFGVKPTPQYISIDDMRMVWQIADEGGFDHCWTFDHFAAIGEDFYGVVWEGWMLLAAMAQATKQVRIGCMVTGNTYRHPAVLAKMAATVDHLSGGRLEFGLGAAWADREHTMLGLEFGTLRERMDRFEEACQVIRGLWTEDSYSFDGKHYQLTDAIANPKPVQQPYPPIWVGGKGRKRSLRITAKYADAWNATGVSPEEFAELCGVLDAHCADVGRDPGAIRRTIQLRPGDDMDAAFAETQSYVEAGATDAIYVVTGEHAVRRAELLANQLPRLRELATA